MTRPPGKSNSIPPVGIFRQKFRGMYSDNSEAHTPCPVIDLGIMRWSFIKQI